MGTMKLKRIISFAILAVVLSLPIAAAFRELLELKGDRYYWKADYKEVFKVASEELYKTLLTKVRTAKAINALGADTEYWRRFLSR